MCCVRQEGQQAAELPFRNCSAAGAGGACPGDTHALSVKQPHAVPAAATQQRAWRLRPHAPGGTSWSSMSLWVVSDASKRSTGSLGPKGLCSMRACGRVPDLL